MERHSDLPRPSLSYASNGTEPTRKEAAHKAAETHRKMVEFYNVHTPPQ